MAISFAEQCQASERAVAIRDMWVDALAACSDQQTQSRADDEDLLKWAEIAYVASRKDGAYAMTEASARQHAAEYVRVCQEEDRALGRAPQDHFERGLQAYFLALRQVFIPKPNSHLRNGWLRVDSVAPWGEVLVSRDYCPACAPKQHDLETRLGARLPEPHEHSTMHNGDRFTYLKGDSHALRCCRCEPAHLSEVI